MGLTFSALGAAVFVWLFVAAPSLGVRPSVERTRPVQPSRSRRFSFPVPEARRRRDLACRVERGLPEVVDLLELVVGAGRTSSQALFEIAPRVPEPFDDALAEVVRRSSAGEPFVESVQRLRTALGPPLAPLVHALRSAETDGVPLAPALQRVSDEAHRRRRVRAEEAARKVPVLMLFPLVFCVLPAFGLLTVVPLMAGSIADLQLPG